MFLKQRFFSSKGGRFCHLRPGPRSHCAALIVIRSARLNVRSERPLISSEFLPIISSWIFLMRSGIDQLFITNWEWVCIGSSGISLVAIFSYVFNIETHIRRPWNADKRRGSSADNCFFIQFSTESRSWTWSSGSKVLQRTAFLKARLHSTCLNFRLRYFPLPICIRGALLSASFSGWISFSSEEDSESEIWIGSGLVMEAIERNAPDWLRFCCDSGIVASDWLP